jgi:hypothetical protein
VRSNSCWWEVEVGGWALVSLVPWTRLGKFASGKECRSLGNSSVSELVSDLVGVSVTMKLFFGNLGYIMCETHVAFGIFFPQSDELTAMLYRFVLNPPPFPLECYTCLGNLIRVVAPRSIVSGDKSF